MQPICLSQPSQQQELEPKRLRVGFKDDEIMVMCCVKDMARFFPKDDIIVWCDQNIESKFNKHLASKFRELCELKTFINWQETCKYIESTQISCRVLTSGTIGKLLVQKIFKLEHVCSIYVFCQHPNYHRELAMKYEKIVCVENDFMTILLKIHENIKKKSHLPAFCPLFDDSDKTENNYLHLNLKGLINFSNRQQSKKDFLRLATEISSDPENIADFEKNYKEYDMKAILNWYTKGSFLYKITNNCLRIGTSDSILYCRLILKDLETAIKEKYQQGSKNYNGLLYRGTYLSDDEWTKLRQNVGKDIEMHGFLSCSKKEEVALKFAQRSLITIIVPAAPDKGEQGFAELREYSEYPNEDEVLFNVQARFTILEATVEKMGSVEYRHLVLLYGANAMKRYFKVNNPCIEIKVKKAETIKCQLCERQIILAKEELLLFNLSKGSQPICETCLWREYSDSKRSALICFIPLPENWGGKQEIYRKIDGFIMHYDRKLAIPFYGYKCIQCSQTNLDRYYRCVECQESKKIYCKTCLEKRDNLCIGKHTIVLENHPFVFWSEKMTEDEYNRLEYHKKLLSQASTELFQPALTYFETQKYAKAEEYYLKFLEQNGDIESKEVALCLTNLGVVYDNLGQHKKAISHISKALEMYKLLSDGEDPDIATIYANLGSAYDNSGEYKKALEAHNKSLQIRQSIYGEKHHLTATSYNNLGLVYSHLKEYKKAMEHYLIDLRINIAVSGEKDVALAAIYNNFGAVSKGWKEYGMAIDYYSKALDINISILGDKHPDTAFSYNNLAVVYQELKNYSKSQEYYIKALNIFEVRLSEHPDTATSYVNLGSLYLEWKESEKSLEKAEECYTKALNIFQAAHKDLDTANTYNKLGSIYKNLKQYEKALKYYSKALEIRRQVLGNNHKETANSYINMANIYQTLKQYEKSIELCRKGMEIRESLYGKENEKVKTLAEKIMLIEKRKNYEKKKSAKLSSNISVINQKPRDLEQERKDLICKVNEQEMISRNLILLRLKT